MANEEDKELYKTFWTNYGTNVKLGVIEDSGNRSRLTKLLMYVLSLLLFSQFTHTIYRFMSSKTGDYVTLDDYVSRMKEGQDQIFYLAGTSKDSVEKSPLIERVIKRGYPISFSSFFSRF